MAIWQQTDFKHTVCTLWNSVDDMKHETGQILVTRGAEELCPDGGLAPQQKEWFSTEHEIMTKSSKNWVNECNKQVPCLSANQADKWAKTYNLLTIYPNSILDIFAWMMDHRPQKKCDASANLQVETTQFNDCDLSAQSSFKSHEEHSHLLASRISSSSMRLCSALSLMCCSAR